MRMTNKELIERAVARGLIVRPAPQAAKVTPTRHWKGRKGRAIAAELRSREMHRAAKLKTKKQCN